MLSSKCVRKGLFHAGKAENGPEESPEKRCFLGHKGFSFLDVFSPGVTYNHDNTYQRFRPRMKKLEDDAAHDCSDLMLSWGDLCFGGDQIPIGKFFERTDVLALHEAELVLNAGPLLNVDTRIPPEVARSFVEELI